MPHINNAPRRPNHQSGQKVHLAIRSVPLRASHPKKRGGERHKKQRCSTDIQGRARVVQAA